jgi:hypothetical protein
MRSDVLDLMASQGSLSILPFTIPYSVHFAVQSIIICDLIIDFE